MDFIKISFVIFFPVVRIFFSQKVLNNHKQFCLHHQPVSTIFPVEGVNGAFKVKEKENKFQFALILILKLFQKMQKRVFQIQTNRAYHAIPNSKHVPMDIKQFVQMNVTLNPCHLHRFKHSSALILENFQEEVLKLKNFLGKTVQ